MNIGDQAHLEVLIDKLIQALGDISPETTDVNIFVDVEENEYLPEEAKQWHQMINKKLQNHFSQIGSFTRGNGKDVRLNTASGELRVFDDKHRLLFSNKK